MEFVEVNDCKPKPLMDQVTFEKDQHYVKMYIPVVKYYHQRNLGELEEMSRETMQLTYIIADQHIEFRNYDEFYGQGMVITFKMIKAFKIHLKGLGLEVR